MGKLTLEKTLKTSFTEIRDLNPDASLKAFRDYNRRIRLLGAKSRLGVGDVLELVTSEDVSAAMARVAEVALSDTHEGGALYHPGCSAVVVSGGGRVMGVYDNPNSDPTLTSYGPGLMWALLKVGQEQYAARHAQSSAAMAEGYRVVSEALTGKPIEATPHEERHHIGGASNLRSLYPTSDSMRRYETELIIAGVSGVLTTERFRRLARSLPELYRAIEQADTTEVLGGFDGNMFAGSLDSTLGSLMLVEIVAPPYIGRFTDLAVDSIAKRHASGINVH